VRNILRSLTIAAVLCIASFALAGCESSPAKFALQVFGKKESIGAEVFIDGKQVGVLQTFGQDSAHFSTWLPHGTYSIEVRKAGFTPYQAKVVAKQSESEQYLHVDLKRAQPAS
jgi:hypothetical protein